MELILLGILLLILVGSILFILPTASSKHVIDDHIKEVLQHSERHKGSFLDLYYKEDKSSLNEFITERNTEYASNISDFNIGDYVKDKLNGNKLVLITDKTLNTIEVNTLPFKSKDPKKIGVVSKNWYLMSEFNKRFSK